MSDMPKKIWANDYGGYYLCRNGDEKLAQECELTRYVHEDREKELLEDIRMLRKTINILRNGNRRDSARREQEYQLINKALTKTDKYEEE